MPIHPEHLLSLSYVARTGSLSQAARELQKTQPALSMQMKALGKEIGQAVVARNRRGVSLTAAGKALLPQAQAVARAVEIADRIGERLHGLDGGVLRIVTTTSMAVYYLPPFLAGIRQENPGIEIKLAHNGAAGALDMLQQGNADLAIARPPFITEPRSDLIQRKILDDATVLALPREHPLVGRTRVTAADIDGLDVVLSAHPSSTRQLVDGFARAHNIEFHVTFEALGVEAVKEAVLQGLGVGFLPKIGIQREVASGDLAAVPIDHAAFQRPVYIFHFHEDRLSPWCAQFLRLMKAG